MYIGLGVSESEADSFVSTYKERYKTISVAQTFLLPHAKEAVLKANSFARLGVVTTKTTAYTIPILENMEIFQYFETIIGRQEVINPKPHPEPIYKAMESMNIDVQNFEVYMIGDTKLDLIAAKTAGVIPIAVLTGYDTNEILGEFTEFIFDDVYKAVEFIQNR
jgi:phosphoglycolate phosphatase